MSTDPHDTTPDGPGSDEPTEVRTPVDPFAPPVAAEPTDSGSIVVPEPEDVPPTSGAGADAPASSEPLEADGLHDTSQPTSAPPVESQADLSEPYAGDAATDPGWSSIDPPPSAGEVAADEPLPPADPVPTEPDPAPPFAAAPAEPDPAPSTFVTPGAAQGDWLKPDAGASAATPEPDPVVRTPSAFTPLGTPEPGPLDQAKALTDKPEVMVGLAFVGGAVASFILKRFGR